MSLPPLPEPEQYIQDFTGFRYTDEQMRTYAAAAAAKEREECANVAHELGALLCAAAIRARGTP